MIHVNEILIFIYIYKKFWIYAPRNKEKWNIHQQNQKKE